jgi:hypothetical protein
MFKNIYLFNSRYSATNIINKSNNAVEPGNAYWTGKISTIDLLCTNKFTLSDCVIANNFFHFYKTGYP